MTNLVLNVCFDVFSIKNDLFWVKAPYTTLNVPQIVNFGRSKKR